MQSRQQALEVLQQTREILSDRLAERVLETTQDLWDDANGESFRSEIELLYEQYAAKLVLINQILANFSATNPDAPTLPFEPNAATGGPHFHAESASLELGATPGEGGTSLELTESTWQTFVRQIRSRNVLAGGETLAMLFQIPLDRAELCASHYLRRSDQDSDFAIWSSRLFTRLFETNEAARLEFLAEAFGLNDAEAMETQEQLRRLLQPNLHSASDNPEFWFPS